MANVADQLDTIEKKVMSGLKDFQKATVERIDYLYRHEFNDFKAVIEEKLKETGWELLTDVTLRPPFFARNDRNGKRDGKKKQGKKNSQKKNGTKK